MSIALSVKVRDLEQQLNALIELVKALAAEVDALKEAPKRGRPPKENHGQG